MGKRNLCGLGLIAAKGGGPGFNLRGSSKPLNCQTPTLIENFCPFYRYFSMEGKLGVKVLPDWANVYVMGGAGSDCVYGTRLLAKAWEKGCDVGFCWGNKAPSVARRGGF